LAACTVLGKEFASHDTVKSRSREYVRGAIHTDTIEGFFQSSRNERRLPASGEQIKMRSAAKTHLRASSASA